MLALVCGKPPEGVKGLLPTSGMLMNPLPRGITPHYELKLDDSVTTFSRKDFCALSIAKK